MLLQSLLLVVTLALIGSALLTSTLVTAKSSFHSLVLRQSRSAMTDATASFISWAQTNIKKNGIDQLPVWASTSTQLNPEASCGKQRLAFSNDVSAGCTLYRTISWNVTGYSNADAGAPSQKLVSEAINLATAQNERRISATINVTLTNASGSIVHSRLSREITARVFHAAPYMVISAERDATSEAGTITSAEGDTAGYADQNDRPPPENINGENVAPATLTDTRLRTTIKCVNIARIDSAKEIQNGIASFIAVRSYGNLAWSYEMPCVQKKNINAGTAPHDFQQPFDGNYANNSTTDNSWRKGDDSKSSFAP